ncbi:FecR family protein [Hyphococcus sp.]|uniref:FecR family protein n=3 Tax=Hyphococcus sp. TaxID=2038636 RepID=UPI0035C7332F
MGEPRKSDDKAVIDEATGWFSLLQGGAATEEDRRRFEEWRNADPANAAAYEKTLAIWRDVGEFDDLREIASDPEFGRSDSTAAGRFRSAILGTPSLHRLAYTGFAFLALIAAAIALSRPAWLFSNIYETQIAETIQIEAPDGSIIDLGPESRLRIAYDNQKRQVFLSAGEAFFDVRKDSDRRFLVTADETEIEVTGTRFNVHQGPSATTISVAEGAVQLRRKSKTINETKAAPLQLLAGQQAQARINDTGLTKVVDMAPAKVGAWRTGRLHYSDTALRDVIADANRYSQTPIIIADESLLDMKLVAAFKTSQIDAMIDGLPEILPLTIDRSSTDRIVLRSASRDSSE